MKLYPPFLISGRLKPALRLPGAIINLENISQTNVKFIIDFDNRNVELYRGEITFGSNPSIFLVEHFQTFLEFLENACSVDFPIRVVIWANQNHEEICHLRESLTLNLIEV